ncbi:MAG: GYF domain-containing protein [Chthoniobacteraceae bacterium]
MDIFIIREGRQTGPFSEDAVKAFLTEGTARPADMGWCRGMAEWRPLGEVLTPGSGKVGVAATPPPAATNGTVENHVPATAKQKAFLTYLGAEFGENLTKERAALAVSDAMETPKLQARIRKWYDDKLRMHAEVFQDEIDFRKANRTARYLERIQTEGADVLKDVTKAHVQVLVESLDKRQPGWESEPESALWDHLLPALGEHFPQLVQPAHKGHLKPGSAVKRGSSLTRGIAGTAGIAMLPPRAAGTLGAMLRGIVLGAIALGGIVVGHQYWQEKHGQTTSQVPAATPEKKETSSAPTPPNDPKPEDPAAQTPGKLLAETAQPAAAQGNSQPPEPAPAPAVPNEPAVPASATSGEKPVAPATPEAPAVSPEKPVTAGEKNAVPAAPAPAENATLNAPPAPPRTAVKLTQRIGVMLSNGQVDLPAGTVLRYLATEGQNVRVSWNNNVFFVPAMATDVNEPLPAASDPAATPPAPGKSPATPAAPVGPASAKPKKPADDL